MTTDAHPKLRKLVRLSMRTPGGGTVGRWLNLGCGRDVCKGWTNLDKYFVQGVDVVHDIETGTLPFEDDTFTHIMARDFMEHIPHRSRHVDGELFVHVVNEMIRVSMDGATWSIISPCRPEALDGAGHCRIISPGTFNPWLIGMSSAEMTNLAMGRLVLKDKVNIRRWNPMDVSRFGKAVAYGLFFRVHKMGDNVHGTTGGI